MHYDHFQSGSGVSHPLAAEALNFESALYFIIAVLVGATAPRVASARLFAASRFPLSARCEQHNLRHRRFANNNKSTMARNAEKAMTTLARWRAAQSNEGTKREQERRPYLASECRDLRKADKWRMQIIREIAKKVAQIQNAGLGEFRIRDLNDEINKLLREKRHWESQIKELGGPDYSRVGPRMLDHEGREVPGNRGYKYFGAAKELPGVRELFEQEPPPPPRKTRAELMKDIDADYYGYRDDDDGILLPLEQKAEQEARESAIAEWEERQRDKKSKNDDDDREVETTSQKSIPTQQDIQLALLARKKQELLEKYVL